MATWPSGKAEACKAFTPGSNPGVASKFLHFLHFYFSENLYFCISKDLHFYISENLNLKNKIFVKQH